MYTNYEVGPHRGVRVVDISNLPQTAAIHIFGVGDPDPETTVVVKDGSQPGNLVRAIAEAVPGGVKLRLVYVSRTVVTNEGAAKLVPASSHTKESVVSSGGTFHRQGEGLITVRLEVTGGTRVLY